MAPKRGGGSSSGGFSSGGDSEPLCPGFLSADDEFSGTTVAYYVNYVLFFVMTLAVFIATCCIRKRAAKLKGFLLATLFFMTLAQALLIIFATLSECSVGDAGTVIDLSIACSIFFLIGQYLLLVTAVWSVNALLSKRLTSGQTVVKIITLAIIGIMGALTAGYVGLSSYNTYQFSFSARGGDPDYSQIEEEQNLAVAYWSLYLVSVIAGGALSAALLVRLRSRNLAVSGIIQRVAVLNFCMLVWVIFTLIPYGASLERPILDLDTRTALYYISCFFQIFSYICIISLGKSEFWRDGGVPQIAYNSAGYGGQPAYVPAQPAQQYYYQQPPMQNVMPPKP